MGNTASSEAAGDGEGKEGDSPASYWTMARQGYQEVVNAVIRPPRAQYSIDALGPDRFQIDGAIFERTDLTLTNARKQVLQCSHWEPVSRPAAKLPCCIYMHGNASCRAEARAILTYALRAGLTVFAFDFAGSGHSDGEWVSLGFFERDDLQVPDLQYYQNMY